MVFPVGCFVMAAAVTLLPAVLGFAGHTIDRFALPFARRGRSVENSFWTRWSRTLQARPWPAAIIGLVILVVLAVPFFGLRLGVADAGNDPTSLTTRRAYDLLSQGFACPLLAQRGGRCRHRRRRRQDRRDPGVPGRPLVPARRACCSR
jgi:uncharacterized membrane protein YdfJ with MMPL/SSD domain